MISLITAGAGATAAEAEEVEERGAAVEEAEKEDATAGAVKREAAGGREEATPGSDLMMWLLWVKRSANELQEQYEQESKRSM